MNLPLDGMIRADSDIYRLCLIPPLRRHVVWIFLHEATSGEKQFPYESRKAHFSHSFPEWGKIVIWNVHLVTNREIYHATFLLSGGVP